MRKELNPRINYCDLSKKEITEVISKANVKGSVGSGRRNPRRPNHFVVRMRAQTKPAVETAICSLQKNGFSVKVLNSPRQITNGDFLVGVKCIVIAPKPPVNPAPFPENGGKKGTKKRNHKK